MSNWVEVTTNARRNYEAALKHGNAQVYIVARAEYRHQILSWYFALLVPMRIGTVVPDEVALLLAEQWDLDTSAPS